MTEAWLYEYYREKIMRFYGREEELQVLKNFLLTVQKKKISQMVTVIGRRRVGKTTLILKAFENFLFLCGATKFQRRNHRFLA